MPKSDIKWAIEEISSRNQAYTLFDQYFSGKHRLLFATEKFRNAFGNLFRAFADNLCPSVVETAAERLHITGWDGQYAEQVQTTWDKTRLDRLQAEVYANASKLGDSYVIVWPDTGGNVKVWPQQATQCCVEYDEDDLDIISKAAKVWITKDKIVRANLYYPDHIERYQSQQKQSNGAPEDPDKYVPLNGQQAVVTNEYGVCPMFHFGNDANVGEYGVSDLSDVIPLQDALNKSMCDMLVAMEFVAFPQRWVTGLQVEVDEDTGKPKNPPFTPGVDRIWAIPGDNVTVGQFQAAQLPQYVEVQNDIRKEICRVTGTPPHLLYLVEQMPTGEALKVGEGRLVKKVERRQRSFGAVWADAEALAMCIDGTADDWEDVRTQIIPVWDTASPHNPLLDAETTLVREQVGTSKRQGLRELGYTDAKIDAMFKELDEEAQQAQARAPQPEPQDNMGNSTAQDRTGGGKPTPYNRKGKAGQPRQAAPAQQQAVKAPNPNPGKGEYAD